MLLVATLLIQASLYCYGLPSPMQLGLLPSFLKGGIGGPISAPSNKSVRFAKTLEKHIYYHIDPPYNNNTTLHLVSSPNTTIPSDFFNPTSIPLNSTPPSSVLSSPTDESLLLLISFQHVATLNWSAEIINK